MVIVTEWPKVHYCVGEQTSEKQVVGVVLKRLDKFLLRNRRS